MVLVTALVVLAGCHEKRVAPDIDLFHDAALKARERAASAVDRAKNLRSTDALAATRSGRYDLRSIRFTESLDNVTHSDSAATHPAMLEKQRVIGRWSAPAETVRIVGALRPLEIKLEPISSRSIGAIAIRATAKQGDSVRLQIKLAHPEDRKNVTVRIDVIADDSQHEYVVDLRGALDRVDDHQVEMCVVSLESGDEAELGSVELLARSWKYDQPWGVMTERIGSVTRPSVYLRDEGSLVWPLEGRWRDARLDFALAEVAPDRRVRVRLELNGAWGRRLIAESELLGGGPWIDQSVDLGEVDLDGATLSLSVEHLSGPDADGVVVWGAPVLWEPAGDRLNILVLLEDALRADRMSIYGHHRATTPFKERFFADGVRFERCVSQSTKTRFSCPSFMTSLRPLATGVYGVWNLNPRLDENYITLAEVFNSRGWATASFLQNANAGPDNGLDQGFERVVENIPGRADEVYGGPALDWIESNRERNFFGYFHVADPHQPYNPPPVHRGWYEEILAQSGGPKWSDPLWLQDVRRALYDGEVASNDGALPKLIDHLSSLSLLDETLIVLIADHGEHLGERGLWDHIPPSYLQVINVPMLMRLPKEMATRVVVEQPVQLVDLMPTLLEFAEMDSSRLPLHGRSLVPLITGDERASGPEMAVVQEAMLYHRPNDPKNVGSLVWDRWHFLHSDKVRSALFDHRADRVEDDRLTPSKAFEDEAMGLLAELRRLDDELRRSVAGDQATAVEIDLENIANLEALGYLDD